MKVREFIDSLTLVTDTIKDHLKKVWKNELDRELNIEDWNWMWEEVKEAILEEFEENCPEDEEED